MLFSSITFLYYFLPLTLVLYFLSPGRLKSAVLLLASLVFYGWGEPRYVLLMVLSILSGYVFGLLVERYRKKRAGRALCVISVGISLSFLLCFKYLDFFLENLNRAAGLEISLLGLALPIGISFYTFQIISYTVDVYRGERAQRNLIHLAAYVVMFPQLIAGPIVRYSDIAGQLTVREHSFSGAASGIRRFVIGLGKKILIANQLGELCAGFRASEEKSVLFYWLYAVAFSLHIYFDFSGYSDMAIGLGRVFGFRFLENFHYPYISASITEFWRRWHISLGSWFRDYVYIPLGGNRKGQKRQLLNILIVWMLTGFWHGAAWNFILWGLYFAFFLTIEKLWLLKLLKGSRFWPHVYTLFLVMISFVIFNGESMGQLLSDLAGLVGTGGIPLVSAEAVYYLRSFGIVLLTAVAGATPVFRSFMLKISKDPIGGKVLNLAEPFALAGVMLVITAYLVDGSFNPFLYFRF
ncbi:MBOAT family protein [Parablautia intestinalis]|uniref:MBOAT family protein n=1 Tax=Parablautia intestinalis TaxID=2320100 RepID=A0A3A9AEM7_9FIRM|nr:MBOAT family O-acyltransferase [Parablautia intestinalis]RKI89544.1 MBOAT family protein [Parablautia intestinalis]